VIEQKRQLAKGFKHDPAMEALLRSLQREPDEFAKLPPTKRIAVGHYQTQKAAFVEVGKVDKQNQTSAA